MSNENIANVVKRNSAGIDEDTKWILGRPNFWCGRIAQRLRTKGIECETKAESEQALVINIMMALRTEYGDSWKTKFDDYLNEGV